VSVKGYKKAKKPNAKKKFIIAAQISGKVHGKKNQGMIKYETPLGEIHPEAQE
jgi:hypothetical protein